MHRLAAMSYVVFRINLQTMYFMYYSHHVTFLILKYPAWLDEKKSALPSDVHKNYTEQYKLVCEICSEYDKEDEKDTEEVKKKRFDKLMGLMQKVSKQDNFE